MWMGIGRKGYDTNLRIKNRVLGMVEQVFSKWP